MNIRNMIMVPVILAVLSSPALAKKHNIVTSDLRQEALKWEMHNSGPSGRTAQQFINYLLGSIDK